jgi:N-acetylmuramic acid 6-phosphate etherase
MIKEIDITKSESNPQTESVNPSQVGIETWDNLKILQAISSSQEFAIQSLRSCDAAIAIAADEASLRLSQDPKARIVYIGAGTPARLIVQDGTELIPTFGWPDERLAYVIAGGSKALLRPVEGAEDDAKEARKAVKALKLKPLDICIAVSASGTTPFTCAALEEARAKGAYTIAFANNEKAPLLSIADVGIFLNSGPEIIVGSTRMAAGTAQKAGLNMLSTLIMIRLNRVFDSKMIDMMPTNDKLMRRAVKMIADITGSDEDTAYKALKSAKNQIKPAILMSKGMSFEEAQKALETEFGDLRAVLTYHLNDGAGI